MNILSGLKSLVSSVRSPVEVKAPEVEVSQSVEDASSSAAYHVDISSEGMATAEDIALDASPIDDIPMP